MPCTSAGSGRSGNCRAAGAGPAIVAGLVLFALLPRRATRSWTFCGNRASLSSEKSQRPRRAVETRSPKSQSIRWSRWPFNRRSAAGPLYHSKLSRLLPCRRCPPSANFDRVQTRPHPYGSAFNPNAHRVPQGDIAGQYRAAPLDGPGLVQSRASPPHVSGICGASHHEPTELQVFGPVLTVQKESSEFLATRVRANAAG